MDAYPRYRFDHSFGNRVEAANLQPVVEEPPPDPLDVPRHSERALQAALAEARNAARADGLLQGRQEGEAAAARRIEAETAALLDALADRLDGLAGAHDLLLERLEAQGAVVLVALVRRLTPRLLDGVARAEVERLAGEALRAAGGAPLLRLNVHPELSAALEARLAHQTAFKGRLEIVPDPALARGALDASWETGGLRRDPEALEAALDALAERALSMLTPPVPTPQGTSPSRPSIPSPPRGEGRGEGEARRGYEGRTGGRPTRQRHAVRPPHPSPLPGGERGTGRLTDPPTAPPPRHQARTQPCPP